MSKLKLFVIIFSFLILSIGSSGLEWNNNMYTHFKPWSTGQAELGFGETDETTTLTSGHVTYYFKNSFPMIDQGVYSNLLLYVKYDDGFVAYINGREVARSNMPSGEINETTLASTQHLGSSFEVFDISSFLDECFREENMMEWDVSIEVHQYQNSDTTLSFNAYLMADASTLIPQNSTWEYFDSGGYPELVESDPLTIIQKPITGIPTVLKHGESFDLILRTDESTSDWLIKAVCKTNTYTLTYSDQGYDSYLGLRKLQVSTEGLPYFTYDLIVEGSGNIYDRTENCLKVVHEYRNRYQIIHMTDTHIPEHYYTYYSTPDTEDILENMDVLNPEFLIITGDIVNRGDEEWQTEIAQNIFRETEVPIFVIPGNHDTGEWCGQGWARENWRKYFGFWYLAPDSPENQEYYTFDHDFTYGNMHYILMETYVNYSDYDYEYYGHRSLTTAQRNWLNDIISEYKDINQIVFYHYDFNGSFDSIWGKKNVKYGFYGHTHSDFVDEHSDYILYNTDSVVREKIFRLVKIKNNEVLYTANQTGTILNVSYSPSNDGTANTVIATITNSSSTYLENLRVDIVMPDDAKFYNCSYGEIIQEVPMYNGKMLVSVEFNLNENETRTITVTEDKSTQPILVETKIYPNPVKTDACFIYINYDQRYELTTYINIYNIVGEHVKKIQLDQPGIALWDLSNEKGTKIASGIYLIEIKTKGTRFSKTKVYKVAIIK